MLGFGETRPGSKTEPNGRSVLRMGSIAKAMAGQVLASMAADGTVKLTDPLAKYAPPGAKVPSFAGRQITLIDLATYTAGLPRELPDAPGRNRDRTRSRASRPTLLALAVGRDASLRAGRGCDVFESRLRPFGRGARQGRRQAMYRAAEERVTDPLGMSDTSTRLAEAQKPRAMTGLDLDGTEAPLWETPAAMDASGNVFTTGDDMVKCAGTSRPIARRAPRNPRPRPRPLSAQHDGFKAAVGVDGNNMDALGLGWTISVPKQHRPLILAKSGGIAGFMTYVVLAPTRGVGVFVVANRLNFPMFQALTTGAQSLVTELHRAERWMRSRAQAPADAGVRWPANRSCLTSPRTESRRSRRRPCGRARGRTSPRCRASSISARP